MTLLGLLPLLVLILIFVALATLDRKQPPGVLFLEALLAWGGLIVIFTEVLSLVKLLQPLYATALWALTALALTTVVVVVRPVPLGKIRDAASRAFTGYTVLLAPLGVVAAILLITALVAPPNFWDAVTYHMSRVVHWAQNHSVGHYQTDDFRQLYMPPFTSFVVLHFQLLAGSDVFANIAGWLSLVGTAMAVYLTTVRLGARRGGALLAAVFVFTIPSGVLEASSVQTNLPTALWLAIYAYFLLADLDEESPRNWLRIGAALGLAVLSKYTAAFYALPFALWYGFHKLRQRPLRAVRLALVVAVIAAVINLPHLGRNYSLFGSPLYPDVARVQHSNAQLGVAVTVSNVTRNAAQHVATRNAGLNSAVVGAVQRVHDVIGMDVAAPGTSLDTSFQVFPLSTHEATTGNLLHLIIATAAAGAVLATGSDRRVKMYALMPLVGFVLFSSLVKWGLHNTRLQLPGFVLVGPVVGYATSRLLSSSQIKVFGLALILASLPWVLSNMFRPVAPVQRFTPNPSVLVTDRLDQYFMNLPYGNDLRDQYVEAAEVLADESTCSRVGIDYVGYTLVPEYLVWVTLQRTGEDFVDAFPVNSFDYVGNNPNEACAVIYIGEDAANTAPSELPHAQLWHWPNIALSIQTDYVVTLDAPDGSGG